jgi:hypothetical protein
MWCGIFCFSFHYFLCISFICGWNWSKSLIHFSQLATGENQTHNFVMIVTECIYRSPLITPQLVSYYSLTPKWAIFQLYQGENKLYSVTWQRCPPWIVTGLVHWHNHLWVDVALLWHIILIPSQPAFALSPKCCKEQHMSIV